jgi:hypothetical protein
MEATYQEATVSGFTPTAEQEIAREAFATGRSLAIEAGAGAGKTATLVLLAKDAEAAGRRGQYIAFNRAIVTEAGAKMPANVACNTAHSLAYRAIMPNTRFPERLRNARRMKSTELADALRLDAIEVTVQDGNTKKLARTFLAGLVMRGVTRFCQSADAQPDWFHVPYVDGLDIPPGNNENNRQVARALVPAMRRAWADLSSEQGSLPFKHDHYLKLWQLSSPRINAKFILFDEAQDANPVLMDVVRQQERFGTQLVWVGDSQQQIYTFTGAVNALQQVGAEQTAFLTRSFRFGPAVADVANDVLAMIPDAELRLSGTESIPSRVGPVADPSVILCRTNARAVRHLLQAIEAGQRPHIVGGGKDVLDFAKAARDLMNEGWTSHPELACFDSWDEVQLYVQQDEQGGDLRLLVSLIDEFSVDVIIDALGNMPREDAADVVLSTAHKAKGREWDRVQIADDFPAEPKGEELRLLYVAVTRARLALDISAVEILVAGASCDEDDSAAASIATDAPASGEGAESEDGSSPAASAAGPVPATDADVAIIEQRLGAIEDPIVRAAVAGALGRIEERLAS